MECLYSLFQVYWNIGVFRILYFFSCIPWYCFKFFSYHSLLCEKTRLGNPEVRKVVDQAIHDYLTEYLELHPDVLDSILSKALNAFKVIIYF